jgi:CRISPR-associated endonuclease Csn1
LQKELELDDFIARQLTDTGYIVRATGEYLRCLFDQDHHVLGLKGQLTAELRWHWGLDTILQEMPDSPAWRESGHEVHAGEKNRADHRHHAIDAVVIALTNRRRLHQLADIVKRGGAKAHGEILEDPWPNFREDVVQAIKKVNVSHRVERKVAGKLHEETLYGPTPTPGEWVLRKPVISLSPNEIERIRDERIRSIREAGIDASPVYIRVAGKRQVEA